MPLLETPPTRKSLSSSSSAPSPRRNLVSPALAHILAKFEVSAPGGDSLHGVDEWGLNYTPSIKRPVTPESPHSDMEEEVKASASSEFSGRNNPVQQFSSSGGCCNRNVLHGSDRPQTPPGDGSSSDEEDEDLHAELCERPATPPTPLSDTGSDIDFQTDILFRNAIPKVSNGTVASLRHGTKSPGPMVVKTSPTKKQLLRHECPTTEASSSLDPFEVWRKRVTSKVGGGRGPMAAVEADRGRVLPVKMSPDESAPWIKSSLASSPPPSKSLAERGPYRQPHSVDKTVTDVLPSAPGLCYFDDKKAAGDSLSFKAKESVDRKDDRGDELCGAVRNSTGLDFDKRKGKSAVAIHLYKKICLSSQKENAIDAQNQRIHDTKRLSSDLLGLSAASRLRLADLMARTSSAEFTAQELEVAETEGKERIKYEEEEEEDDYDEVLDWQRDGAFDDDSSSPYDADIDRGDTPGDTPCVTRPESVAGSADTTRRSSPIEDQGSSSSGSEVGTFEPPSPLFIDSILSTPSSLTASSCDNTRPTSPVISPSVFGGRDLELASECEGGEFGDATVDSMVRRIEAIDRLISNPSENNTLCNSYEHHDKSDDDGGSGANSAADNSLQIRQSDLLQDELLREALNELTLLGAGSSHDESEVQPTEITHQPSGTPPLEEEFEVPDCGEASMLLPDTFLTQNIFPESDSSRTEATPGTQDQVAVAARKIASSLTGILKTVVRESLAGNLKVAQQKLSNEIRLQRSAESSPSSIELDNLARAAFVEVLDTELRQLWDSRAVYPEPFVSKTPGVVLGIPNQLVQSALMSLPTTNNDGSRDFLASFVENQVKKWCDWTHEIATSPTPARPVLAERRSSRRAEGVDANLQELLGGSSAEQPCPVFYGYVVASHFTTTALLFRPVLSSSAKPGSTSPSLWSQKDCADAHLNGSYDITKNGATASNLKAVVAVSNSILEVLLSEFATELFASQGAASCVPEQNALCPNPAETLISAAPGKENETKFIEEPGIGAATGTREDNNSKKSPPRRLRPIVKPNFTRSQKLAAAQPENTVKSSDKQLWVVETIK
eukprot:CAMPEP_0171693364 /NCGR_PEP_ID=MMETSP0991-20121206/6609_1 /TAXON_ID=483369 /ORGANISM="non described non described, Strain CCMP2098" /LENGTH=1066 /DNA_ID=CAMNT_0012281807 /DNA_START=35 /DNA_END=3236 /DNA_ORIENTATION=+